MKFVASEHGARLDADLWSGGGTDDTAALQALLDRARDEGTAHVLIDGPARVSGLDVYSNTTIEGTPGAGLYLSDDSDRSIIRNAHRTRDEIVDENITIRRLFLGGNRQGQQRPWVGSKSPGDVGAVWDDGGLPQLEHDRSWKSPMQLLGVRNLIIEDVEIRNGRAFMLWLANASHVVLRNVVIDADAGHYPVGGSIDEQLAYIRSVPPNVDGIHINGPADHVLIEGGRVSVWDDAIALDANDWGVADLTIDNMSGPYCGQGPITDVVVRNVHLDNPSHGIRLLSADQRIDRVLFEGVHGLVRMRGVNISHFTIPAGGDIGTVEFRGIQLGAAPSLTMRQLHAAEYAAIEPGSYPWEEEADSAFFVVNAAVENLRLENVVLADIEDRPVLLVGPDAKVGSLAAEILLEADPDVPRRIRLHDRARTSHLELDIRQLKGDKP